MSRRAAPIAAVVVAAAVVAAAGVGYAASLGGVTAVGLFAQAGPATVPVGVHDAFTGAAGTSIAGQPTTTGQTWTVAAGAFLYTGTGGASSTSNTGWNLASVATGFTGGYTAQVTITRRNPPDDGAGLYLNTTPSGTAGVTAVWFRSGGDRLVLRSYNAGTVSTWAVFPGLTPPPVGVPTVLTVGWNPTSRTFTISLDGNAAVTYTMTAAQYATYGANSGVGLAVDASNKPVLSNFWVWPA